MFPNTININTLLVGLDMTQTDDVVLRYTAWFTGLIAPQKIYFVHIAPDLEEVTTPNGMASDEWIASQMQEKVTKNFENYTDYEVEFMADDGVVYERISHWVKVKKPNLLLIGKKPEEKNKPGALPSKMITELPCSLLFATNRPHYHLDNIIVSSDFSKISEQAMQFAVDLASKTSYVNLYCQYIYDLPVGYTSSGKSEAEYEQVMSQNAKEKYFEFIDKIDQKEQRITPVLTYAEEENAPELVYESADEINADLIVAGGRGRTFLANLLLKSFTKELFEKDAHIPLLILKSGEQMDFSEAVSKL